ncbi:MAG TPA: PASTA domain-containing protein [Gaiellaceae bacterium]|nr:PASTA domain-containing protein [Gaiellaceae bacterium]
MAARLTALLPRLVALTVIWLLGAATFTLAAEKKTPAPSPAASEPVQPRVLVVPDVRGKAYVFAKGILQDTGFAWRVQGSVQGYAANTVVSQSAPPRARVIDNGAPTIVLTLAKNKSYAESGLPENTAPFHATALVYLSEWRKEHAPSKTTTSASTTTTTSTTMTTTAASTTTEPAPPPEPAKTRKPDFLVPGAPKEPVDEIALPMRARRLGDRLAAASKPTSRLVNFWLYQHAWVVTGARFGWHDGAEALRILIRIDESLQRRWGFGARSEAVARHALAEVEAHSR